jgi:hypothetical protein
MFVAATLALAGCGQTASQVEAARIKSVFASDGVQAKACADAVNQNPTYAPIVLHMPLGHVEHPTLDQLTDAGIPAAEDVQLIKALHADMQHCRPMFIETLQRTIPAAVPITEDMFYQDDQVILKLVQHQISWGKANELIQQTAMSHKKEFQGAAHALDAQLQASHEAEMAQRAAISGAIAGVAADAATDAIDASYSRSSRR